MGKLWIPKLGLAYNYYWCSNKSMFLFLISGVTWLILMAWVKLYCVLDWWNLNQVRFSFAGLFRFMKSTANVFKGELWFWENNIKKVSKKFAFLALWTAWLPLILMVAFWTLNWNAPIANMHIWLRIMAGRSQLTPSHDYDQSLQTNLSYPNHKAKLMSSQRLRSHLNDHIKGFCPQTQRIRVKRCHSSVFSDICKLVHLHLIFFSPLYFGKIDNGVC